MRVCSNSFPLSSSSQILGLIQSIFGSRPTIMPDNPGSNATTISISGRRLALPPGRIFHIQKTGEAKHELGAFRAWAGYKNFGCDEATNDLVHFQHVLSFADTKT